MEDSTAAKQAAVRAVNASRRAVQGGRYGAAVRANQYALRAIHAAENGEAGRAEASARLAEAALGEQYKAAWREWVEDGGEIWDQAVGDGIEEE